jgi:transcriptional regulator with XRE-family HTH domain
MVTNCLAPVRKRLGLTQAALAERLGLDSRRISDLETRRLPARVVRLVEVARALGVGLGELLQSTDTIPGPRK